MQWMAPTTGIAMCPISTALEERGESAYGYKQTSNGPKLMSALPPKSDIPRPTLDALASALVTPWSAPSTLAVPAVASSRVSRSGCSARSIQ